MGIVFVTVPADQEYVSEGFKAGARGYVLGDAVQTDLIPAVRVGAHGDTFLSPAITAKMIDDSRMRDCGDNSTLSEYQKQLWCLLAAGYNEQEIATRLNSTASRIRA